MTKSKSEAGHHASVVDNDNGVKKIGVRWQCSCGRHGQWTFSTSGAEAGGARHERRFKPWETVAARRIKNAVGLKF